MPSYRTTGRLAAVLASVTLLAACASGPATQVPAATAVPTATPPPGRAHHPDARACSIIIPGTDADPVATVVG